MGIIKHQPEFDKDHNVYLSISKECTPEQITRALAYLSHCRANIWTYDNSTDYDEDDIDEMDALLVLPPLEQSESPYHVGRGQYSEIDRFREACFENHDEPEVYIISDLTSGLFIDEYGTSEVRHGSAKTWQDWGLVYTNDQGIDITNYKYFRMGPAHFMGHDGNSVTVQYENTVERFSNSISDDRLPAYDIVEGWSAAPKKSLSVGKFHLALVKHLI